MSQRGLVGGGPKPGLHIQGVVEQMLVRAAIGSSCLYGHKTCEISEMCATTSSEWMLSIHQSLWELTLSRQQLLIRRGELSMMGCFFLDYDHVLIFGGVKFQVLLTLPTSHFAY